MKKNTMGPTSLRPGLALALALSLPAAPAAAQTVIINVGAGAGTGLEIGRGESTEVRHSPAFVTVQAGVLLDNDHRFELGAALLCELEGRVGVALEPQLRVHTGGGRVRGYLVAGVPIFVAPYSLFGISAGPGIGVRAFRTLSIFGELVVRAYPFGSDLPDGSALFHGDLIIGARNAF